MFLRIMKKNYKCGKCEYAYVLESYRVGDKVKQRVIKNFGLVETAEDKKRVQRLFEAMKKGEKLISLNELSNKKTLDYGMIYVTEELLKKHQIKKSLGIIKGNEGFDIEQVASLLIANRFYRPSSDLDAVEWINEEAYADIKVQKQHVYRTLDKLIKRKEEIEKAIFEVLKNNFRLKVDVVFYDLTSTYFEGNGCESADYGYSRDREPKKKQIVVGLVLIDGLPIAHHVFPGNTADKATLKEVVQDLRKRFRIQNIIFVADRGTFSITNLKEFENEKGYNYIFATKRRREKLVKELMTKEIRAPEGKNVFAEEVHKEENRRYILCINEERRKQEIEDLKARKKNLINELNKLKGKKNAQGKVFKILGKNKRLFDLNFENGFSFSLNKENFEYENKIAGKYLLVTSTDLSPMKVMESYKDLKEVEDAFRDLKSFVKERPVFHWKDRRVKAHTFVCVLNFLIKCLIKKSIALLKISVNKALRELRKLKISEISVDGETMFIPDKIERGQSKILKALGIDEPMKIQM